MDRRSNFFVSRVFWEHGLFDLELMRGEVGDDKPEICGQGFPHRASLVLPLS